MNLNQLFKALQAGYERTANEPVLGEISKEIYIKSIKHDIYENALTILLNENLNNHDSPSVYCSARMIIEELAILEGIRIGMLKDSDIQYANLSQRFRFDLTQKYFLESIADIDEKDKNIRFVDKDKNETYRLFDKLKASSGITDETKELIVYDAFTKKGFQHLVKKTLGEDFSLYRKLFSFFLHWNYLEEEVENLTLAIANKGVSEILKKVEELVFEDVSKNELPKYKSFNSYVENKREEMKRLKQIEYSWKEASRYFSLIPIDKYCFKRYKAISLDFKICMIFGFNLSVCKRSKTFVELCSINERLAHYYKDDTLDYVVELIKTSSYIRLSSIVDDQEIIEKMNISKCCNDLYIKYIKDKHDLSFTKMVELLGEGALSFYSLLGDNKSIAYNVLSFADGEDIPEIDKLLLNVLFKTGNKIDHFTGGYPNLNAQTMSYWTSRTYLQTMLIGYSHLARVFASFDKESYDKDVVNAINSFALEMMDYGADEFLDITPREYDPDNASTNPFGHAFSTADGKPFDILEDFYKDSTIKYPFKK